MNIIKLSLFALVISSLPIGAFAASVSKFENNVSINESRQIKQKVILARSEYDSELLKLTNAERKKAGLPALKYSSVLGQAAQNHAEDMVKNNFFSHTGSDGSRIRDRTKKLGYSATYVGENIAAGNKTPEETIRQWMNSSRHRRNILNSNYTEVGFGYVSDPSYRYKHVWVQVFGRPKS